MFHVAAQTVSDMCTCSSQREAGMTPLAVLSLHPGKIVVVTMTLVPSLWLKDEWIGF